jgi:hypothetical protein
MNVCIVINIAMVMLLSNFGPYGIFINVCVVINLSTVMLLRDFGPYGVTFTTTCVYYFRYFRHY